jgi:hypothetical protein
MAGRLLDYLAQGLAAARPVAATLAPKISAGGLAFYYATDTNTLSLLDVTAVAWDALSGGSGIADGDYGDISASAGGTILTIDPNVVTLSRMAELATGTILGRVGAGLGNVEALTMAQVKTALALTKGDVGLANVDNTFDANKPVSTAQATAIGLKLDATHAGTGGAAHANAVAAGAAGFMSGADKTKLDGIALGATANSSDVALLARANHSGTQLAATISDFSAAADAQIAAASVNALADVTIATPSTGQVLKYNGIVWVNDADATGGGGGGISPGRLHGYGLGGF